MKTQSDTDALSVPLHRFVQARVRVWRNGWVWRRCWAEKGSPIRAGHTDMRRVMIYRRRWGNPIDRSIPRHEEWFAEDRDVRMSLNDKAQATETAI